MDDKTIVDLYWQRSDRAIEETAAKYGAYCRTIAYNILSNAEDSEECVNDTYLSAWNSMPHKRPERLSPFLARICRNHALHKVEHQRRLKRGGSEAELALDELSECIPGTQNVEQQVEAKELAAAINHFLSLLPAEERRVFFCRYFFMASMAEISEKFRFSQSKTLSMLHRTRIKLKLLEIQDKYNIRLHTQQAHPKIPQSSILYETDTAYVLITKEDGQNEAYLLEAIADNIDFKMFN